MTPKPALNNPVTRDGYPIPFFPCGSRVVVQRLPPETTIAGFIIPESHRAEQNYATVIAAGLPAQEILDDMGVSIGDTVCFGKYSGTWWEWQPEGTTEIKLRQRVDLMDAKDIFGAVETVAKVMSGSYGIIKHELPNGGYERRFAEELKKETK